MTIFEKKSPHRPTHCCGNQPSVAHHAHPRTITATQHNTITHTHPNTLRVPIMFTDELVINMYALIEYKLASFIPKLLLTTLPTQHHQDVWPRETRQPRPAHP